MAAKTPYNTPLPFRAPKITREQLNYLKGIWGENRSQAIIRCIDRAFNDEKGKESSKSAVEELVNK